MNDNSRMFFLPHLSDRYPAGYEISAATQIECSVDQYGHLQRSTDILSLEDKKCDAGVADPEQCDHEQIFPVGSGKLPQTDIELRFCTHNHGSFRHQHDHENGEEARDDRQIENETQVYMKKQQQEDRQQRAQKRAQIISDAFQPERFAPVFFVRR
jgi:hypothetical protein